VAENVKTVKVGDAVKGTAEDVNHNVKVQWSRVQLKVLTTL